MEKLAKECYAYPELDMYPIHTKQAATESIKLFQTQQHNFMPAVRSKIAARLETAADFHQIGLEKQAYAQPQLIDMPVGAASVAFSVPKSLEQAKQLAMHITKLAGLGNTLSDLRDAARVGITVISDTADANNWHDDLFLGSEVRALMKMAGLGVGDKETVADEFRKRAFLIACSPRERKQLMDVARSIENMDDSDFMKKASLDTFCDTLDAIDTQFGLKHQYGHSIQDPKQACYAQDVFDLHKQAADRLYIPSTDTILSKQALMEQKQAAQAYFSHFHNQNIENQAQLMEKVASLDEKEVNHFIGYVEGYTSR